jgi:hypothetical protein
LGEVGVMNFDNLGIDETIRVKIKIPKFVKAKEDSPFYRIFKDEILQTTGCFKHYRFDIFYYRLKGEKGRFNKNDFEEAVDEN